ncbi:MAG: penicillin-binding protein 2, partial [Candidatus Brocadiae bacterium]|nr:penicillin-binding protein 2 [Candidatus Brocadiia bacterium]
IGGAGRPPRLRAGIVLGVVSVALLLLAARLCKLQIGEADRYRRLARQQQQLDRKLSARRGRIYDRQGRLLAASVRRWSIYADPKAVKDPDRTALVVGNVLGRSPGGLARSLRKDCFFVWIKRQVSEREAERVRDLALPGVYLQEENKRLYPQGRLGAHVVGFTDIDGRGLAGIERKMDALLRGRPGLERVLCDGGRRIFRSAQDRLQKAPFNGYDVFLTLDAYVQNVAEQELAAAAEKHEPECATAIVMDVRDGSVLAMASWPSFDPQEPAQSPVGYQRNVAVSDAYEFGSAFKPITVGLALEQGVVAPDTEFECHQGEWRVGRRTVHDVHPYGTLTVSDILCHSSNIGAGQVGQKLGPQKLHEGIRGFGLGRPTGIALPGEVGGIMRPVASWSEYSIISIAFGQELAVTAMSMARAFASFANGGVLLQPRIVKAVVHSHTGKVVYTAGEPSVSTRPLSAETAGEVLRMMQRVVTEGTGRPARLDEYVIAGKTGTAQLLRQDGKGYSSSRYLSTFIGVAPVPDCRIVVLVTVKAPTRNGYYGSVVAAPVVRNITLRTLRHMNVPQTESTDVALGETG